MRVFKRRKPTDRQLTDEKSRKHGKEVTDVEGHDSQHPAEDRKSAMRIGGKIGNPIGRNLQQIPHAGLGSEDTRAREIGRESPGRTF